MLNNHPADIINILAIWGKMGELINFVISGKHQKLMLELEGQTKKKKDLFTYKIQR